jgi:hypothetical protein
VVVTAHAPGTRPDDVDEYLEKPLRVDRLIVTANALISKGRAPAP